MNSQLKQSKNESLQKIALLNLKVMSNEKNNQSIPLTNHLQSIFEPYKIAYKWKNQNLQINYMCYMDFLKELLLGLNFQIFTNQAHQRYKKR